MRPIIHVASRTMAKFSASPNITESGEKSVKMRPTGSFSGPKRRTSARPLLKTLKSTKKISQRQPARRPLGPMKNGFTGFSGTGGSSCGDSGGCDGVSRSVTGTRLSRGRPHGERSSAKPAATEHDISGIKHGSLARSDRPLRFAKFDASGSRVERNDRRFGGLVPIADANRGENFPRRLGERNPIHVANFGGRTAKRIV